MWGNNNNRFDMANLLPPVIIIGLMFLLLPLCLSLFAPLLTGHTNGYAYPFPHGRRKRDLQDQQAESSPTTAWNLNKLPDLKLILDLFQTSMKKFNQV